MNYPEIFPTISMDTELGKYASYANVDMHYFTNRLREGGLSDEEISQLNIHFSAKEDLGNKRGATTQGIYRHPDRSIEVAYHNANEDLDLHEDNTIELAIYSSALYSDTLDHEIEHAIAKKDIALQKEDKSYKRRVLGRRLIRSSPVIYSGVVTAGFTLEFGAHVEYAYLTSFLTALSIVALKKTILRRKFIEIDRKEYLKGPEEARARLAGENAPLTAVMFIPSSIPVTIEDNTVTTHFPKSQRLSPESSD